MRSDRFSNLSLAVRGVFRCAIARLGAGPCARRLGLLVAVAGLLAVGAGPQHDPRYELTDEPILATTISEQDIEMRGRWVRQWVDDQGTLILLYSGGFQLKMGARQLTAHNAVVWIVPGQDEKGRKYYELTVYLSEEAEVREAGGTLTADQVLLVRSLRTYGRVAKLQDAHLQERMDESPLYQQALRDRALIESSSGEEEEVPGVSHPGEVRKPAAPKAQRVVRYRLVKIEPAQTATGETVFVSSGGVYFAQAGSPTAPLLEIRADAAVVFPAEGAAGSLFAAELEGTSKKKEAKAEEESAEPTPASTPSRGAAEEQTPAQKGEKKGGLLSMEAAAPGRVRAVYLEGDVVLSAGTRFVRAHRLFYDFERDRALILDAVFRMEMPERGVPIYIRADEIRQLSAREFAADHAVVTTSEFYTPSYHVGAERVVLREITARDSEGRATSPVTGNYEMRNSTLNIGGVPIAWWPYSQGTLEESETLLRRLTAGYGSKWGMKVETTWSLFGLAGIKAPPGYDARLRLDYFSKKGPAAGVDVDYERDTHYGLFRSYFIEDTGKDNLGPLRKDQEEPSTSERGRVLWRHRHYLPGDWEATIEVSYVSDPNFLETYEKRELQEGKEQETLLYLKRARGNEAITLLANWRLIDSMTQTEHLPELTYRRIGDTFLDPLVSYSEARVGMVEYLPAKLDAKDVQYELYQERYQPGPIWDRNFRATDATFRTDARQELEWPVKLGPANLVPFASVRGSYWDGQPRDEGGLWRGLGVYGVRGSTSFSRADRGIQSQLLDINGIRHIIQPEFATWWGHSNTRSENLTPFDYGVETVDGFYGGMAGVRQTWQTKRGPEGKQHTVDLVTLNLQMGLFGDTDGRHDKSDGWVDPLRPENSRSRNYLAGDLVYRLSDTTSVLYDFNFDLNDRAFDQHNLSIAVQRDPRLAYVFGVRYAGDINLAMVGGGWNYKLNEKHITTVRGWWDVDTGDLGEISLGYVRKLPRWYAGIDLKYDNIDDEYSINFSLWPEGVPEWALGSRRYTGLGTSTGIRP